MKNNVVSSYNATILQKIDIEEIEDEVDEALEIELRVLRFAVIRGRAEFQGRLFDPKIF